MDDRTSACGLAGEAATAVEGVLRHTVSRSQRHRVGKLVDAFVGFASVAGADALRHVTHGVVESFVRAPDADGVAATVSTMHLRRTAIRQLFREARRIGLATTDPTVDVVLPARSPLAARPLEDDEVALCRASSVWSLTDDRRAALWALAEATCRTSELPHIRAGDVDVAAGGVWIHGGKLTVPRFGRLTDWGSAQLLRRLTNLGADDPVGYRGDSPSEGGQASTAGAIVQVLTRAGLADEPDVRPASVAAWAGRQVFAETGRIDSVARALGLSSLDRAARIIAWDWREDGPAVEP